MAITTYCAVDLFCGAGGLTNGLIRSGIPVAYGADHDPACAYPYTHNHPGTQFHATDITQLTPDTLTNWYPNDGGVRVLAGCPPCQPFSTYNRTRNRRSSPDRDLAIVFARLAAAVQPDIIVMENVPQFATHPILNTILTILDGYHVTWTVLDLARIGLPQTRRRFILIATRTRPIPLNPIPDRPPCTVRDTIGHLPPLPAGGVDPDDPLHRAARLSPINLDRIRHSAPGGTWADWPANLHLACHRKATGSTFQSVYGRMTWDAPAPTITTQCYGYGNGRFGHPDQDRAISLREAALLQTFPDTYQFTPPGSPIVFNTIGRMIGNAVPPTLGAWLGHTIQTHHQPHP